MSESRIDINLPTMPQNFGVVLSSPNLRKIDYSGLDYDTARKAIIEYIATYYPNEFNDFVSSNGIIMLVEIIASVVAKLSMRSDILAQEATLPSAFTEEAVVNHLALINQRMRRQTAANTDIEAFIDRPIATSIEIEPATTFKINGPDNNPIIYELYRAPGDYVSKIIIPAGKRGVIAYAVEGQWAESVQAISAGGINQRFVVDVPNVLEDPIFIYVSQGSNTQQYKAVFEPIQRYGPNDAVAEVIFIDNRVEFQFGDDVTGSSPKAGSTVEFRFRVGGGRRGRIGVGQIEASYSITPLPPVTAPIPVLFRNIVPSRGGNDRETIEEAKRRAPRDYSLQRSIVTAEDYANAVVNFSHPTFGTIRKAVATLRSNINANLVQIYVISEGADGYPTAANEGLKRALITYLENLNVLTDYVEVLDGSLKPVDLDLNIIIDRNADASVVKDRVEAKITDYFNLSNWDIGEAFFTSNFIDELSSIDGVAFVDLYAPNDNIIPTGMLGDKDVMGVGYNEIIVEGKRKTSYYYEKSPPPGGVRAGR